MLEQPLDIMASKVPGTRNMSRVVHIAAKSSHPVLIIGEPGTGKETIARLIHSVSHGSARRFRARNCIAIRPIDLERELAIHIGLTDNDCTTLYLDEIRDLHLESQAILLRALQRLESAIRKDAGLEYPRIIAASTGDLQPAISTGAFRRDLYFRLNAITLRVPPLRERRQDIPLLACALLRELSLVSGHHFRLSDCARQAILTYDWPGNIRELKNCLQRACCSSPGPLIKVLDLPAELSGTTSKVESKTRNLRVASLCELEKQSIEEALRLVDGDKRTAAKLLGIGKATLYRKLKQYDAARRTQ